MKKRFSRRDFLKLAGVTSAGLALSACGVNPTDTPTATSVPLTGTPLPTSTISPTPTLTPTATLPLEQLPQTKQALEEFVRTFQFIGVDVSVDQFLQKGLEIRAATGKDGKQYEIAFVHIDPSQNSLGGDYPVMLREKVGKWGIATLDKIAQQIDWRFGAALNFNKDFREITLNNFGIGNSYIDWNLVEAEKDKWDFSDPGYNIDTAFAGGISIMANLIWGNNIAAWAKQDPDLHTVMIDYITQVMMHYKGQVKMWNVYNEAKLHGNDDIFWNRLGGIQAVRDSYVTAKSIDPGATLLYNDFVDLDGTYNPDRDRLLTIEEVVSQIQSDGNLDGIALQIIIARSKTFEPNKLRAALDTLSKHDLSIYIPEFSVFINGENIPANLVRQAQSAAEIIGILKEYDNMKGIIAFPIEDRLANKIYHSDQNNSGLWLKTEAGSYIPKPIVFEMMKAMIEQ